MALPAAPPFGWTPAFVVHKPARALARPGAPGADAPGPQVPRGFVEPPLSSRAPDPDAGTALPGAIPPPRKRRGRGWARTRAHEPQRRRAEAPLAPLGAHSLGR